MWTLSLLQTVFAALPVVIYHGMGDSYDSSGIESFSRQIQQSIDTDDVFVYAIRIGDSSNQDRLKSYFDDVNEQIGVVCEQLKGVPELKDGFNAVGISQGGQFLRAYVERCNDPPVRRLITIGAQHQGVSALPGCVLSQNDCAWYDTLLKLGVFNPLIHSRIVQAQYYKSHQVLEQYLQVNRFLTDINNELPVRNEAYKRNLSSLEMFVMFMFEKDTVVVPKESSWFGFFDGERMQALEEQDIYQQDRIGLRLLNEEDRLRFETIQGADHLQFPEGFVRKRLAPYLK